MTTDLHDSGMEAAPLQPRAPRTKLLLAATIEDAAGKAAVRIRDLSEGGALLEGGMLPDIGERLTLRRAELAVAATVAWRGSGRCGVRFDRAISVAQWAAGLRLSTGAHEGQARVDAIQAQVRAGAPAAPPPPPPVAPIKGELDQRLAEEIDYVARLIETMGDTLADEPAVIHRHPQTLQGFDLATQVLRHLAAVLSADDRGAAIASIGMADLRARLTRRANF